MKTAIIVIIIFAGLSWWLTFKSAAMIFGMIIMIGGAIGRGGGMIDMDGGGYDE